MITIFRPNLVHRFYSTPIFHDDYIKIKFIDKKKIIDTIKNTIENEEKNNEIKENNISNSYKNMYSGIPITNLFNKND